MNQVGTDRDKRGLEQEVLGGTQATAIMASHGGADERRIHGGGRADDFRGPTDCSRAGGGGARGGYGELMSQGDGEDPEGRGGTDGSDDRRVDPNRRVEPERQRTKMEPRGWGSRRDEVQDG